MDSFTQSEKDLILELRKYDVHTKFRIEKLPNRQAKDGYVFRFAVEQSKLIGSYPQPEKKRV